MKFHEDMENNNINCKPPKICSKSMASTIELGFFGTQVLIF
jgi:hypothetical protein